MDEDNRDFELAGVTIIVMLLIGFALGHFLLPQYVTDTQTVFIPVEGRAKECVDGGGHFEAYTGISGIKMLCHTPERTDEILL